MNKLNNGKEPENQPELQQEPDRADTSEQEAVSTEPIPGGNVSEEALLTATGADPQVPRSKLAQRKKNIFDQIWDWFASVRVGVSIIVLLAVGSVLGTIYPQVNAIPSRNPDAYYFDTYGTLGDMYHRLGLSDTYNSWWYLTLVMLLAISLVIVSIDRGVPLYKSLKNQPIARKVMMLKLDRLYTARAESNEQTLDELAVKLKKSRYKVRREQDALLAEKGRIPRFGAYIIHTGLIIIIIGVFTRLIPGWYYSDMVWLKEGERKNVPQVGFAIQNNGFQVEYYNQGQQGQMQMGQEMRPKKYETDAAVYVDNKEMAKGHLKVNEPLIYNNTRVFQNSFDPTPMFKTGKVQLTEKKTGKVIGVLNIDFNDPKLEYKVGAYMLKMVNYYPDIKIDPTKGVYTNSQDPYNPGMQFDITGPGIDKPVREWMLPMAPFIEQMLGKTYPYELRFQEVQTFNMTGLKIERDLGIPIVYTGLVIVLTGLVLVFYFQHRRVWARLENGVVHVGANTNKNWIGMTKELNKAVTPLGFDPAALKQKLNKK
jgi:cytochrome c biogenesis protein